MKQKSQFPKTASAHSPTPPPSTDIMSSRSHRLPSRGSLRQTVRQRLRPFQPYPHGVKATGGFLYTERSVLQSWLLDQHLPRTAESLGCCHAESPGPSISYTGLGLEGWWRLSMACSNMARAGWKWPSQTGPGSFYLSCQASDGAIFLFMLKASEVVSTKYTESDFFREK